MTAETVAARLRVPLYQVCAGELGTNAAELEYALDRVLRLGDRWGAIILIDEADVFMEQRTAQDLVRNSLVSVLLRKLEYSRCIIFMTTNHLKAFDPAITSRVHMTIPYQENGPNGRRQIWKAFLDKAVTPKGSARVSDRDLDNLVASKLNARQVSPSRHIDCPC